MSDLFLYGTLRYVPLLERVLGRPEAQLNLEVANLADHQVCSVKDQSFPAITPALGQVAQGVLLRDVTDADLAALNYYEGGFDYDLRQVEVETKTSGRLSAQVYFPRPGAWVLAAPWDLQGWIERWGPMTLRAAEEVMAYQGRLSAADMVNCFPSVRRRAASWLVAQARSEDPERRLAEDVVVHHHKRAYVNFFAMEEMDLQFRRYDGSMSPVMNRCVALVGHAAVVLPYDPLRDEVLLVEQFRAATFIAGEKRPWMWEPVAGLIDPGETPENTARREAMEEAGVEIGALECVSSAYPSSGASGEFIHIFVGLADLSDIQGGGGLASEGEDLRSKILSYDALMAGIDAQEYQDLPLIAAALWLSRHRERLRNP